MDLDTLELTFSGELFQWRGPAPHYFIAVPADASVALHSVADAVTYGWGVVPVEVRLGGSAWPTSLFPKDGGYLVPIKQAVRLRENLRDGDTVDIQLVVHL
jgi:hypothetical protein